MGAQPFPSPRASALLQKFSCQSRVWAGLLLPGLNVPLARLFLWLGQPCVHVHLWALLFLLLSRWKRPAPVPNGTPHPAPAALPVCPAALSAVRVGSERGFFVCLSISTLSEGGQPHVHAQLYLGNSQLSRWGTAAPTHSVQGSLACGCCRVFLTPRWPWSGQPHLRMQQCPTISALPLDPPVLCVGTAVFR